MAFASILEHLPSSPLVDSDKEEDKKDDKEEDDALHVDLKPKQDGTVPMALICSQKRRATETEKQVPP
jgi:hypothetical protein